MKSSPRPMRFNHERDPVILGKIHELDGIAGAHQILRFRDKTGQRIFQSFRTTRDRLSKLHQNGYLARLDRQQRAAHSDMVYWLTEKGAEVVAALHGQELSTFHYRKQPRLGLLEHDLAVIDFYLDIEEACFDLDGYELEEFIPSGQFWSDPDVVEYTDERGKQTKKILPDGYFEVRRFNETDGRWYRHRLLLELDRATEDNPRFAREKVIPYIIYMYSNKYERRFGAKSGRVLVVTSGERRMRNMLRHAAAAAGRDVVSFYFTTIDQVSPETILTERIWWRGGEENPRSLIEDSNS